MAGPIGNGFRCHSLYCSLIFFISFLSLFPYLFMMFAVIGSGLSGHAAEILTFFLFPSCLFLPSPHSLSHLLLSLSFCLSLSVLLTTPSLVAEKLVLTHSPPVWHFPIPFLKFRFLLDALWVFLQDFLSSTVLLYKCSSSVNRPSTQTPLSKPDFHQLGAGGGRYTRKSRSICLKWQLFWHAEDCLQDCMSERIISEAQDQSSQTEFRMILAVATVQTVIKIRSTDLPSAEVITAFQKLRFTFKISVLAQSWHITTRREYLFICLLIYLWTILYV